MAAAALISPASTLATDDVAITSGPPDFTNSPNATFTFSSAHSSGFQCSLDDVAPAAFAACTSPKSLSSLAEGQHTFRVRGFSALGGPPGPAVSRTWTVDFTPPDTTLTAFPPALTNSQTATFEFTSPDLSASFQCSLNGSPFSACTSPQIFSGLGDGTRNFSVRAVDPATNVDFSPPSVDWTVDVTSPDTVITAGPGPQSNVKQPAIEFASSEPGSSFQCSVNGGAFVACSSPNVLAALADGAITFLVRAIDGAANVDATPAQRVWTLDTVLPAKSHVSIGPRPSRRSGGLRQAQRFQTTTQLLVKWTGVMGAASYDVQRRLTSPGVSPNSGTWTAWKTDVTATQSNAVVNPGTTACFRARATYSFDNNSAWDERCTTLPYKASTAFVQPPSFTKETGGGYFAGQYVRRAGVGTQTGFIRLQLTPGNAPQQTSFNGPPAVVKRVALVVTKCPDCGKVRVLVTQDGMPPVSAAHAVVDKTIDLTAATTRKKQLITVATFSSANPSFQRRYVYVVAAGGNAIRRIEGIGVSPL